MKLRVLSSYRNGATAYQAGQIVDVSDVEGGFLFRDSPGTFELQTEEPMASGFEAIDRRARGGQRRDSAAQPEYQPVQRERTAGG